MAGITTRIAAAIKNMANAPYAYEPQWQPMGMPGGTDRLPGTRKDWAREAGELWLNPAVRVCLDKWQAVFPAARLHVVRDGEDGPEEVPDHPLADLIARPNPRYAGGHLWQATLLSYLLDGNAYWEKKRSGAGAVVELWYLPHWTVKPVNQGTDFLTHYEYTPHQGKRPRVIRSENMVHFRNGLDPEDLRLGQAALKCGVRSVVTDNEADNYAAALLLNSAVPQVLIQPETPGTEVTQSIADKIRAMWMRFRGDRRGQPLVATQRLKIDKLSLNPQEMALGDIRYPSEARICTLMQVPPLITGLPCADKARTYANYGEAMRSFAQESVAPAHAQIAGDLDTQLLPDLGDEGERCAWDYKGVPAMQPDKSGERKDAALLFQAGVLTRARAKVMCGETPAEDGTDDVYVWQARGGASAFE